MSHSPSSDAERIDIIRREVRAAGDAARARYPLLANQNLIGMSVFLFAIGGIIASGLAYWHGYLSAWVSIPLVAFLTSLLHELEHDLIHWQYFKNNKLIHHLMMAGVWIFRPGTINPWIRRYLHFLHHKKSGSEADIEERGIGNGRSFGPLRWLIMFDTFTGNLTRALLEAPKGKKLYHVARVLAGNFPLPWITAAIWYSVLGYHAINLLAPYTGLVPVWSAETIARFELLDKWVVMIIAPFYLRSFSINFISSNMHYYGNVDSVLKQTQVLTHPLFWPLQLFCFNFGSTHGIHHFVVGEPFYIRQLTARAAHKVMREQGVPFNDLSTFLRRNRFPDAQPQEVAATANG
jgi:fatty acid desaturase